MSVVMVLIVTELVGIADHLMTGLAPPFQEVLYLSSPKGHNKPVKPYIKHWCFIKLNPIHESALSG